MCPLVVANYLELGYHLFIFSFTFSLKVEDKGQFLSLPTWWTLGNISVTTEFDL